MAERIGVYKSWMSWKALEKRYLEYEQVHRDSAMDLLEKYAVFGELRQSDIAPDVICDPLWSSSFLIGPLSRYGISLYRCAQISARHGEKWLEDFAASNVALKIKFMVNLFTHERFPRRFEGRYLKQMTLHSAEVMALAFILGDKEEGLKLGKLLIEAYRRNYYFDVDEYPIFHFMLMLFCRWSGEQAPDWKYDLSQDGVMFSLFESSFNKDADALASCIQAACDFHTHRTRGKQFLEFSNGDWVRYPIQLLMLFRLREWSGLDNPKVDHPLMEGVLGELPPPTPLNPDELTAAVLKRMQSQGYDEDAIYVRFVGENRVRS